MMMNKLSNLTATIGVEIQGILAITKYTLTYTNVTADTIEAIYHFSLPRMASVLSCEVELDQQRFSATLKRKSKAAEEYEDAIKERKRTVLVESLNDGLYAINMGNLEINKSIVIELRIAQVLTATDNGQALTYRLPTNIAPRFGSSNNVIEPEYSLYAQYPFGATVKADIPLTIRNASHQMVKNDNLYQFSGTLDRDVFFTFVSDEAHQTVTGQYKGKHYTLGYPKPANTDDVASDNDGTDLHILMDRSGSMRGQSIALCKQAVSSLLEELPDNDLINITSFGSRYQSVFRRSKHLDGACRKHLRQAIELMQADMGGTELIETLIHVLKNKSASSTVSYLLLITDGQVYISDEAFAAISLLCQQKNVVIHSIGVGYSVSEYVVRGLSTPTGGINTVVNPNGELLSVVQNIAKAVRQSEAITSATEPENTSWQYSPARYYPHLPQLFIANGSQIKTIPDTAFSFAPAEELSGDWAKATVQLAALHHMMDMSQANAAELSEQLEILTKHTSFIMVDTTDYQVQGDSLTTMVVPQSLGADMLLPSKSYSQYNPATPHESDSASYIVGEVESDGDFDFMDIPMYLRQEATDDNTVLERMLLNELESVFWRPSKWTADYLLSLNFTNDFVDRISSLSRRQGLPFYVVVLAYLSEIATKHNLTLTKKAKKRIEQNTCYLATDVLEEAYLLAQAG